MRSLPANSIHRRLCENSLSSHLRPVKKNIFFVRLVGGSACVHEPVGHPTRVPCRSATLAFVFFPFFFSLFPGQGLGRQSSSQVAHPQCRIPIDAPAEWRGRRRAYRTVWSIFCSMVSALRSLARLLAPSLDQSVRSLACSLAPSLASVGPALGNGRVGWWSRSQF